MPKTLWHGLFPLVRAEILRLLFTNPREELYVRQLTRLNRLSLQTVQDELAKLESAHLISSRSNGYQRFYRADSKHPLYATLRRLVVRAALHRQPQPRGQRPATISTALKLDFNSTVLCGRVIRTQSSLSASQAPSPRTFRSSKSECGRRK